MQNIWQNHFQCKIIQKAFHLYRNGVLMLIMINHCHTPVKVISSIIFLSSIALNSLKKCYFIYNSTKGVTIMLYKSNIRYISFKEPFKVFLEAQMSEGKSTPLLAIRHYSFLNLVIFVCTLIFLCKCNYKSLA